jgi:hypothetical protein
MRAQAPYRASRGGWNARDRRAIRAMQASYAEYRAPVLAAPNFFGGAPGAITISDFRMEPYCCGGIGVKLMHKGSDATIIAYAIIHLDHPKIVFDLVIVGSTIKTAAVTLSGGAGFTVFFDAATQVGMQGNINRPFAFPSDLSIPIGGMGAPFAVTFRQSMVLTTSFTAKQAIIHAEGDYGFSGALAMGLRDGHWGADGPQSLTTKKNLLGTLGGLSLGVNGLTFAYGGKIMVGIGAFGFITGPYLRYNTAVGVVNGSSMMVAAPPCKSVRFEQWLDVGVGYQMPQGVTSAINSILRLVGLREIQSHGGIEHTQPLTKKYDFFPAGCDKPAE